MGYRDREVSMQRSYYRGNYFNILKDAPNFLNWVQLTVEFTYMGSLFWFGKFHALFQNIELIFYKYIFSYES